MGQAAQQVTLRSSGLRSSSSSFCSLSIVSFLALITCTRRGRWPIFAAVCHIVSIMTYIRKSPATVHRLHVRSALIWIIDRTVL